MTIVDVPPLPDQSYVSAAVSNSPHLLIEKSTYHKYIKRLLDISLILASAPITVPVVGACAFLVALDGHSPLFRQSGVGRGGRSFQIVKLRSLVPDAEAALAAHIACNAAVQVEWNGFQKLRVDPRISRMGRFLRKTSFDELQQLWNVLLGHMALVGPRPMMESQRHHYQGTSYFKLRPGITRQWQISARNNSRFAD